MGLADFHWCDVIRISVRQICGLVCGVVCWSPHNKGALGSLWWPQQFPGLYKENLFYWGNVPLKNSVLHVGCEYMWVVFFFFFFTAYAQVCSLFLTALCWEAFYCTCHGSYCPPYCVVLCVFLHSSDSSEQKVNSPWFFTLDFNVIYILFDVIDEINISWNSTPYTLFIVKNEKKLFLQW